MCVTFVCSVWIESDVSLTLPEIICVRHPFHLLFLIQGKCCLTESGSLLLHLA